MNKKIFLAAGTGVAIVISLYFIFSDSTFKREPLKPFLKRKGQISVGSEWLNTQAAVNTLLSELRQNPNDSKKKLMLAFAYMQEARASGEHPYYYPAALDLIDEVLDDAKIDESIRYEALVAKGTVLLSLHQFSEAMEYGKLALQINPYNASVYGVLTDANVELGNYKEAVIMADKMASVRPDIRSYSRISYLREIHGDMPGSIAAMKLAISAGAPGLEQTAWARVTLGQLYEKTGDLANAEVQYLIASQEYPYYPFAIAGMARLECKKKHYKEAIKLYETASESIPEFSFKEQLASVYRKMGNNDKVADLSKEVIEMLKEDEDAGHEVNLELSNLYADLNNDYDKALDYAMKEYEARPNNIDVCKALATIWYKKGDIQKAQQFLVPATRTHKQEPSLLVLEGLINLKVGKKEEGVKLIKKSFEADPYQSDLLSEEGRKVISSSISQINN